MLLLVLVLARDGGVFADAVAEGLDWLFVVAPAEVAVVGVARGAGGATGATDEGCARAGDAEAGGVVEGAGGDATGGAAAGDVVAGAAAMTAGADSAAPSTLPRSGPAGISHAAISSPSSTSAATPIGQRRCAG